MGRIVLNNNPVCVEKATVLSPTTDSSFGSSTYTNESTNISDVSFYSKTSTEKTIENVIFNICIAPILTVLSTALSLLLYGIVIFVAAIFTYNLASYYSCPIYLSASISTVVIMFVSKFLGVAGSTQLALITGLANATTAMLLCTVNFSSTWVCCWGSLNSSIMAMVFWMFLEPDRRTLYILSVDSYKKNSRQLLNKRARHSL